MGTEWKFSYHSGHHGNQNIHSYPVGLDVLILKRAFIYCKPVKKNTIIGVKDQLSLNAGHKYCRMLQREHSAILSTFVKLPFVIKIFISSHFEWALNTGITVHVLPFILYAYKQSRLW